MKPSSGIPLPINTPRCPQTFRPYVYTDSDIARLINAVDGLHSTLIEPRTLRTLVLLLYGTGLRLSEALHLCFADVDLEQSLLTIRDTKFYKTRWVPTGTHLTQILHDYIKTVHTSPGTALDTPLLVRRDGGQLSASYLRCPSTDHLVPAGCRCPKAPTHAVDLPGTRKHRCDPGLFADDTGAADGGFDSL